MSLSKQYQVCGLVVPGKPGLIFVEGTKENVSQFSAQVKSMTWQYLQSRSYEESANMVINNYFCYIGGILLENLDQLGSPQAFQNFSEFRQSRSSRPTSDLSEVFVCLMAILTM